MHSVFFVFSAFSLVSGCLASGLPGPWTRDDPQAQHDYQAVCYQITSVISNASQVFFPRKYNDDLITQC